MVALSKLASELVPLGIMWVGLLSFFGLIYIVGSIVVWIGKQDDAARRGLHGDP